MEPQLSRAENALTDIRQTVGARSSEASGRSGLIRGDGWAPGGVGGYTRSPKARSPFRSAARRATNHRPRSQ